MNTTLEYSTRVVQEGDRRCKKSTLNDLAYLTPLRIPLMNPVEGVRKTAGGQCCQLLAELSAHSVEQFWPMRKNPAPYFLTICRHIRMKKKKIICVTVHVRVRSIYYFFDLARITENKRGKQTLKKFGPFRHFLYKIGQIWLQICPVALLFIRPLLIYAAE
jgi:hypothetical protein